MVVVVVVVVVVGDSKGFFELELLRRQPCWFTVYHQRAEKGWLVTCLIFATYLGLVRDVTDTGCWAQNGS